MLSSIVLSLALVTAPPVETTLAIEEGFTDSGVRIQLIWHPQPKAYSVGSQFWFVQLDLIEKRWKYEEALKQAHDALGPLINPSIIGVVPAEPMIYGPVDPISGRR